MEKNEIGEPLRHYPKLVLRQIRTWVKKRLSQSVTPTNIGRAFFTLSILFAIYPFWKAWIQQSIEYTLGKLIGDYSLAYRIQNLPKRIILVRHGESEGNANPEIYERIPDQEIQLTPNGFDQAKVAGITLKRIIGKETFKIYCSPYVRAKQTISGILDAFFDVGPNPGRHPYETVSITEEPRLREQEFGLVKPLQQLQMETQQRNSFGHFYYRYPHGESGADVYGRVATFVNDTLLASKFTGSVNNIARAINHVKHNSSTSSLFGNHVSRNKESYQSLNSAKSNSAITLNLDKHKKSILSRVKMAFGHTLGYPRKSISLNTASTKDKSLLLSHEDNVDNTVVVSHGLTIRILLMILLKLSVQEYTNIESIQNAEIIILNKSKCGTYYPSVNLRTKTAQLVNNETGGYGGVGSAGGIGVVNDASAMQSLWTTEQAACLVHASSGSNIDSHNATSGYGATDFLQFYSPITFDPRDGVDRGERMERAERERLDNDDIKCNNNAYAISSAPGDYYTGVNSDCQSNTLAFNDGPIASPQMVTSISLPYASSVPQNSQPLRSLSLSLQNNKHL